jgi:uncharacterized protein YbjQ (UPF0145 family)
MKYYSAAGMILMMLLAGCATTKASNSKVVVWETKDISRAYEVVGPVSVSEQISESMEDTVQGLAGFISKDGRISGQIPPETKAALDTKREKYKEMIFEKLGTKAKSYDADAIIGAEYSYAPAYVTLSAKATVSAQGTMVKYKT